MPFVLRDYQVDGYNQVHAYMVQGFKRILYQAPTGSGKTVFISKLLADIAEGGKRSILVVHRTELITQSIKTFAENGLNAGIIASGFVENLKPLVQIASVQTLAHRYKRFLPDAKGVPSPFGTITVFVWDEAHHMAAGTWAKIFAAFPDAYHIGLTATPERLDGKGLDKYFEVMVNGPSTPWLIENGYLSPFNIFAPPGPDLTGVRKKMGDFLRGDLEAKMDVPTITGDIIAHYKKHVPGGRLLVFGVTIDHSKHMAAQAQGAGISSAHLDGETRPEDRSSALRSFSQGGILWVCNVELFGEGFDLPGLDAVSLARPTDSLILYLQQVGRALRPVYAPGFDLSTKDGRLAAIAAGPKPVAYILDHAGNCIKHGMPDDERFWSLKGREEREKKSATIRTIVCPNPECFKPQRPNKRCRYCGTIFVTAGGREFQEVDGELVEMDTKTKNKGREKALKAAKTLEQLIDFGKSQGYSDPEKFAKTYESVRRNTRDKAIREHYAAKRI